ncbi:MAG: methyl-accepting chemotaxis protein [Candidatus Anaerobiospirillum pullicola]|uniref:Methyl-accepting chemotaxis protein n=1 Tax=Candidatus Anaerobiospirillum pullicola TaxID=2838451 RepID=A0A948TGU5_9GAMM|nr:methyl-accepting chemotaxis protein [Candidatus Anaerobiospirillum pullicola]
MRVNTPVIDVEHKFPNDPSAKIISVTDLQGNITDVNDTFVAMSGFSREELIGQPQNIVRHPDMPPQIFAAMWKALKAGESFMGIIKNRCKDGSYYWVNAFIMPIIQNGQIVGYESVRTAATDEQIARATRIYKKMREGKQPRKRMDIMAFVCYGLFLISFAHATIHPSVWSNVPCIIITLGIITYIIYRKNHLQKLITRCFDAHPSLINSLIYTRKAGQEGAVLYDIMYNLKEVDTILTRVKETSDRLTAIAQEGLSLQEGSATETTARNQQAKELLSEMQEIADNISNMINDISNSAKETVRNSDSAAKLVSEGKDVANQTMKVIDNLSDSINKIASAIADLASRVDDIEKASVLIKDIASQTNLLALNASIEAARAGEAGRGFAVVADEVRSLSLRTEETTVQIHNLIERFKKTAQETVALAGENQEHAQEGVAQIHATNQKLDEVLASIDNIHALINNVNETVQSQASTADNVNIKVQHISSMSDENVASSNNNLKQMEEVSTISTELNSMISRFSNKDHV